MTGPDRNGPDLSFAGFVLLAVLGTFFWKNAPLVSSRPDTGKDAESSPHPENQIPAKLWQDPFEPMIAYKPEKYLRDMSVGVNTCTLRDLKESSHTESSNIRVLIPMLTLGQDAEVVERRRRRRYAVISGLAEAGYVPDSSSFIGSCILYKAASDRFDQEPIVVPYEWYRAEGRSSPNGSAAAVLVLWLNETLFARRPLGRFRELAEIVVGNCDPTIANNCKRDTSIFVLGPARSSTLSEMARRAIKEGPKQVKTGFNSVNISGIHILSPTATVADSELVPGIDEDKVRSLQACFSPSNCQSGMRGSENNGVCVSFLRTIQSDDALAKVLVEEITKRPDWLPHLDHIALISEWDTPFGRSLPRSFAKSLCHSERGNGNCSGNDTHKIIRYRYLRGIDGKISGHKESTKPPLNSGDRKQTADSILSHGDTGIRRPTGNGQYDYLRRIAGSIQRKDRDLRASGEGQIRAIGIMGSDVYDKLLILRTLRSRFPHALFFTTDLDAQLLHPEEFQWTRNLLVASSFGLELREDIQGGIPPFRDSYQTSMFLSTLLATRYDITQYSPADQAGKSYFYPNTASNRSLLEQIPPLLFEVGRSEAVRLGTSHDPQWSNTVDQPPPVAPGLRGLIGFFVLAAVLIMVLHQIKPLAGWPVIFSTLAAALFLVLLGTALVFSPTGEPLSLTLGVSAWPAEFIRYLALCLSLYFLGRLFRDLSANCARINRDYFGRKDDLNRLTGPGKTLKEAITGVASHVAALAAPVRSHGRYDRALFRWSALGLATFAAIGCGMYLTMNYYIDARFAILAYWGGVVMLWYCLLYYPPFPNSFGGFKSINAWVKDTRDDAESKEVLDAWIYWKSYCELGVPGYRAFRSISLLLLFMAFAAMTLLLTEVPVAPTRGEASFYADKVMLFTSVPAMLILIFIVLDEFRMCIYWIKGLRRHRFDWGEISIKRKNQPMGTFATAPDMEWVKVQLIAERTSEIGQLIHYPYLVIILMLISRNSYFDNWGIPPGLAVVLGVNILLLFVSAMKLRREAESCRRSALSNLNLALLKELGPAENGKGESYRNRIKKLIEDVQSINEGAFLPISKQPLMRASLPLLGAIGLTVGEYAVLFR